MTPRVTRRHYVTMFVLLAAWVTMTVLVAVLVRQLPRRPLLAVPQWGTLYAATLVVPAVRAFRLHRRLHRLQQIHGPLPDSIAIEIDDVGWSFVTYGLLAAVAAMGLVLFYAAR